MEEFKRISKFCLGQWGILRRPCLEWSNLTMSDRITLLSTFPLSLSLFWTPRPSPLSLCNLLFIILSLTLSLSLSVTISQLSFYLFNSKKLYCRLCSIIEVIFSYYKTYFTAEIIDRIRVQMGGAGKGRYAPPPLH